MEMKIGILITICITIIGITILVSNEVTAQDKEVISVFSGEYTDPTTEMFYSLDAWSKGRTGQSSTLSDLYKEGWQIVEVLKTNASATTLQLLVFLEIDSNKFTNTRYSKHLEEDESAPEPPAGSVDDL